MLPPIFRSSAFAAALLLAGPAFAQAPGPARAPSSSSSTASAVQRHADREALKSAVEAVLSRPPLDRARVGVQVVSLETGEIVYSHGAEELLNPASNVKLFTGAAAVAKLGPEYRYETEFYTDAPIRGGKVRTLYVRGKGDPTITTERLYGIVAELSRTGLKEISEIVIDESWFDTDRVPAGYDQEKSDRAYAAPPGAVSLNWNAVGIYVRPGEKPGDKAIVEVEPPSDFFVIESEVRTDGRKGPRVSVGTEVAPRDQQKIVARGAIGVNAPTFNAWRKIDNPPMYFGQTLKQMLGMRGVKVKGRVRLATAPIPRDARLLHVSQSETLDVIIKRLNKVSSNFVAEQLIKTLGAEVKGAPGTHAKGIEVVEEFLAREVGIARGTYVMRNGSGLNDANRFSASQVNRLLLYSMATMPTMPEFLSSLGIAGKDGTLRWRFEGSDAVGRLRAKTGTLENVSALSGYVVAVGGEQFAFSIMANDYPGRAGPVVRGLDAIGAAVASLGSREGPSRAVADLVAPESRPGNLEEVKSRVRTYLALGQQGDKRNISFLRTAWRSERDPALRAVVAISLFQSDPQDHLAAKTLLDSFMAGPEVYGRLRQVAHELETDVPGLEPLLDLAAGGNVEALSRVVELASASAGDARAELALSGGFSEIARSAPEELLSAMWGAAATDREAARELLARGLSASGDTTHPFWPALKKTMDARDVELAEFAKQTEAFLTRRTAEHAAPRDVSGAEPGQGGDEPSDPVLGARSGG